MIIDILNEMLVFNLFIGLIQMQTGCHFFFISNTNKNTSKLRSNDLIRKKKKTRKVMLAYSSLQIPAIMSPEVSRVSE